MRAPPRFNQSSCHYVGNVQWIMGLMMRPCKGTSNFYCPGDEGRKEWMRRVKWRWKKRKKRGRGELPEWAASSEGLESALLDPLTRVRNRRMAEKRSNRKEWWIKLITDERSIDHSQSSSNRVCICNCVFGRRRKNVQLKKKKETNSPCLRLADVSPFCSKRNENSTPHHWILLYIQTNISLFHASKMVCT